MVHPLKVGGLARRPRNKLSIVEISHESDTYMDFLTCDFLAHREWLHYIYIDSFVIEKNDTEFGVEENLVSGSRWQRGVVALPGSLSQNSPQPNEW